jgi:hypothetical protein
MATIMYMAIKTGGENQKKYNKISKTPIPMKKMATQYILYCD